MKAYSTRQEHWPVQGALIDLLEIRQRDDDQQKWKLQSKAQELYVALWMVGTQMLIMEQRGVRDFPSALNMALVRVQGTPLERDMCCSSDLNLKNLSATKTKQNTLRKFCCFRKLAAKPENVAERWNAQTVNTDRFISPVLVLSIVKLLSTSLEILFTICSVGITTMQTDL
ncbi:hypothetical protein BDP27DRAFT_1402766, partial [Rhodocollybia butyracea]